MTTVLDGEPHGMTANAITSVSLRPPLLLVCVGRDSSMAGRVTDAGSFALTFMARDQRWMSDAFADPLRPSGPRQFQNVEHHRAVTGCPILGGGVGWTDCSVWSIADGGDHLIVIGEVLAAGWNDHSPLAYFAGSYGDTTARRADGASE